MADETADEIAHGIAHETDETANAPDDTHPTASHDISTLRVLTLNCWGLKYLSRHRHARLLEIGNQLLSSSPPPDLVCLQECWTDHDFSRLRTLLSPILPHSRAFSSGLVGSGLCIFSRFPLSDPSISPFRLNGLPSAFFRGDWYAGKGVASALLRFPRTTTPHHLSFSLRIFNTHLHAPYRAPDAYAAHRAAQAWACARLLRDAALRGHFVLAVGDFNAPPGSLPYRILHACSPVRDLWALVHPAASFSSSSSDDDDDGSSHAAPSAIEALDAFGATCDSALNTWRARGNIAEASSSSSPDPGAQRLDYLFLAAPLSPSTQTRIRPVSVKVGMRMLHPLLKCSLSDHFSVEAELGIDRACAGRDARAGEEEAEAREAESRAAESTDISVADELAALLATYRVQAAKRNREMVFLAQFSVGVGGACLGGIWWSGSPGAAFGLALGAVLAACVGLVLGLLGGLAGGWEMRALQEVSEEVKDWSRTVRKEARAGEE